MPDPNYQKMKKAELIAELESLRQRLVQLEQQDAVQNLVLSEAKYRALVEGSSDFIYVLDKDGYFTFANQEAVHLLGYAPEDIVGRHFSEVLHPQDLESLGRAFHERRTGTRAAKRVEVRLQAKGGATREVEMDIRHFAISASGLYDSQGFIGTHGVARDITERKYQEMKRLALQKVREAVWSMVRAEEVFRVIEAIRGSLQAIGINYQQCGVNVVDMSDPPMLYAYGTQGSSGIAKLGQWLISEENTFASTIAGIWRRTNLDYRRDLEAEDRYHERAYATTLYGPVRTLVDVPFSHGTLRITSALANAFSRRQLTFLQELAEVLSEGFRRMEDLEQFTLFEQRYRTLVETPNFVVMLLDGEGNYLYISPQIETWLGRAPGEFYTDAGLLDRLIHPEDQETASALLQSDRTTSLHELEYRWQGADGRYRWASGSAFPIYVNEEDRQINRVSMIQIVVQDITARREAENRIKASLVEKEVLLKEIHHRVKNNLQIISSLLRLQSNSLQDPKVLDAFEDSQHRIRSMSLIHEELYRSADLAKIDFGSYLHSLIHHLFDSYGVYPERIALHVQSEGAAMALDRAIPLGLIINELVSNALKYAFPDDRSGEIQVAFSPGPDDSFTLVVSDDGVGLPAHVSPETSPTLGLKLVDTLAMQLRCRIQIDRSRGTRFVLERLSPVP